MHAGTNPIHPAFLSTGGHHARMQEDADVQDDLGTKDVDWLSTGACTLFASMGPLLFGFDIGVSPGALHSFSAPPPEPGRQVAPPHATLRDLSPSSLA